MRRCKVTSGGAFKSCFSYTGHLLSAHPYQHCLPWQSHVCRSIDSHMFCLQFHYKCFCLHAPTSGLEMLTLEQCYVCLSCLLWHTKVGPGIIKLWLQCSQKSDSMVTVLYHVGDVYKIHNIPFQIQVFLDSRDGCVSKISCRGWNHIHWTWFSHLPSHSSSANPYNNVLALLSVALDSPERNSQQVSLTESSPDFLIQTQWGVPVLYQLYWSFMQASAPLRKNRWVLPSSQATQIKNTNIRNLVHSKQLFLHHDAWETDSVVT
jgi:hypothetical protein